MVQFDRTANKADLAKAITRVKQNATPARTIHRVSRGVLATAKGLPAGYTLIARVDDRQHVLLPTADQQAYQFLIHPQDIERLHLTAGDKVDLAWHEAEGPQTAVVTWVHHDPQPAAVPTTTPAATPTGSAPAAPAQPRFEPQLNFDLAGRTVLIVGEKADASTCQAIVTAHQGGDTVVTDATKGSSLKNKVTHADLMILITTDVAELSTHSAVKMAKSQKTAYAVSPDTKALNIERALYRAMNDMPAFEAANATLTYPEVTR